jgi:hypothetical protein
MVSWLQLITPVNLNVEREKFLASNSYNPILRYNWHKERLAQFRSKNPVYKQLIYALLNEDSTAQSLARQAFSVEIEPEVLAEAKMIVGSPTPLKNSQL